MSHELKYKNKIRLKKRILELGNKSVAPLYFDDTFFPGFNYACVGVHVSTYDCMCVHMHVQILP